MRWLILDRDSDLPCTPEPFHVPAHRPVASGVMTYALSCTIFLSGGFVRTCERLDGSTYEHFQFMEQGPGR